MKSTKMAFFFEDIHSFVGSSGLLKFTIARVSTLQHKLLVSNEHKQQNMIKHTKQQSAALTVLNANVIKTAETHKNVDYDTSHLSGFTAIRLENCFVSWCHSVLFGLFCVFLLFLVTFAFQDS